MLFEIGKGCAAALVLSLGRYPSGCERDEGARARYWASNSTLPILRTFTKCEPGENRSESTQRAVTRAHGYHQRVRARPNAFSRLSGARLPGSGPSSACSSPGRWRSAAVRRWVAGLGLFVWMRLTRRGRREISERNASVSKSGLVMRSDLFYAGSTSMRRLVCPLKSRSIWSRRS